MITGDVKSKIGRPWDAFWSGSISSPRITPRERAIGAYLLGYLRSEAPQRWISAPVKGATCREITLGRPRELPVSIPPLNLQHRFADRVESVNARRAALFEAQRVDDELFASLQSCMFRGEL